MPRSDRVRAGDTGVFHRNGEPVCDLMYTCSFAAITLPLAWRLTGFELFRTVGLRLEDFLCRVQMDGPGRQRRGAWMRAYHLGHGEYFGSNADYKWGPYTIESGWANAPIGIALAAELLDEPVFARRQQSFTYRSTT